jgi:hypothetical protein
MQEQWQSAVELALAGKWDSAHRTVQELGDPVACWIHAILHKIEGDHWNSRYWYDRTDGRRFEDFPDPRQELAAVQAFICAE